MIQNFIENYLLKRARRIYSFIRRSDLFILLKLRFKYYPNFEFDFLTYNLIDFLYGEFTYDDESPNPINAEYLTRVIDSFDTFHSLFYIRSERLLILNRFATLSEDMLFDEYSKDIFYHYYLRTQGNADMLDEFIIKFDVINIFIDKVRGPRVSYDFHITNVGLTPLIANLLRIPTSFTNSFRLWPCVTNFFSISISFRSRIPSILSIFKGFYIYYRRPTKKQAIFNSFQSKLKRNTSWFWNLR